MNAYEKSDKRDRLIRIIKENSPLAVAYSGGVDSTLLLAVAKEVLGASELVAVTAVAPIFAEDEILYAKKFCEKNGITHLFAEVPWGTLESISGFKENHRDRCYHCKKTLLGTLMASTRNQRAVLSGGRDWTFADGTNLDDMDDYRPGFRAVSELGVISPLKEAGYTKEEIRAELKVRGVEVWDKPAFACLASRIPYGEEINPEKLKAIYTLESALKDEGFTQLRVRHHGSVARLELLQSEMARLLVSPLREKILEAGRAAGFTYVSVDLKGYEKGSLNQ